MNLTLTRLYNGDDCTIGTLMHGKEFLCFTLENPWLGNQKDISCIPDGFYSCTPHEGTKHKETWIINDVEGRSVVVWHLGNTVDDTKGCPLPGLTTGLIGTQRAVYSSRDAMEKLRGHIGLTTSFDLTIRRV